LIIYFRANGLGILLDRTLLVEHIEMAGNCGMATFEIPSCTNHHRWSWRGFYYVLLVYRNLIVADDSRKINVIKHGETAVESSRPIESEDLVLLLLLFSLGCHVHFFTLLLQFDTKSRIRKP
jgi:hypothetical protein